MQISLEVISVSAPQTIPTKNGKSYQAIEVAYKKDGKIEGKKIMSFTNPAVFKAVQGLSQGDFITVTTEKNEAGYWQWEGVSKEEANTAHTVTPQSAAATGGGTTKSTGTSWETKEERAAKQVMIVRQSSLERSIEFVSAFLPNKGITTSKIIEVAREFEAYVMGYDTQSAIQDIVDMDNDIPL